MATVNFSPILTTAGAMPNIPFKQGQMLLNQNLGLLYVDTAQNNRTVVSNSLVYGEYYVTDKQFVVDTSGVPTHTLKTGIPIVRDVGYQLRFDIIGSQSNFRNPIQASLGSSDDGFLTMNVAMPLIPPQTALPTCTVNANMTFIFHHSDGDYTLPFGLPTIITGNYEPFDTTTAGIVYPKTGNGDGAWSWVDNTSTTGYYTCDYPLYDKSGINQAVIEAGIVYQPMLNLITTGALSAPLFVEIVPTDIDTQTGALQYKVGQPLMVRFYTHDNTNENNSLQFNLTILRLSGNTWPEGIVFNQYNPPVGS